MVFQRNLAGIHYILAHSKRMTVKLHFPTVSLSELEKYQPWKSSLLGLLPGFLLVSTGVPTIRTTVGGKEKILFHCC